LHDLQAFLFNFIPIVELGNLIRALVPFEYVEEARAIQEKFKNFLKELNDSTSTIFVPLQLAVSLVSNFLS
jgi:elongator complex protein 1